MTHTPTPEQAAVIDFITSRKENLMISALAGAAKTSTLVMAAQSIKGSTLSIAFNKRIAEELQARMPHSVECRTLNSIGHRALSRFLGRRRIVIKSSKRSDLLRAAIKELPTKEQGDLWDGFADMSKAISHGVNNGWIPSGNPNWPVGLISDAEFYGSLDFEPSDREAELIHKVSTTAIAEALRGTCDYSDQLLIPTLWPASFDPYSTVMVDEVQDLSPLNHAMLKKIVKRNRLIAVGDPRQSIYAFRGADTGAMARLRQEFAMEDLPLTISFRCPQSVIEHVHWHAPAMRWPEWAQPGEVRTLTEWNADSIPDGAAIICRNNAPLMRTALRLIRAGRRPHLLGNDIMRGIIKDLKKFGEPEQTQEANLRALESFHLTLAARYRSETFAADKVACLRIFIEAAPNLGQAIARAEHISQMAGPITLLTGHKSKGLEFDHVFFLDEHLVRGGPQFPDGDEQECNLRYVIATRAKQSLTYIKSDEWQGEVAAA